MSSLDNVCSVDASRPLVRKRLITPKELYDRWPRAHDALLSALQSSEIPEEMDIWESMDWHDVCVTGAGRIAVPLSDWTQERWLVRDCGWELTDYLDDQQAQWKSRSRRRGV